MKNVTLILITFGLFAPSAMANTDREQIKEAVECFYTWDLYGGKENSSRCIADTVLYHRVDKEGQHISYTPGLDRDSGKGEGVVTHSLVDIDVYNDMAIVTSLHQYAPQSPNNTYMKTLIFHKLGIGWRITNVVWGRVTNDE